MKTTKTKLAHEVIRFVSKFKLAHTAMSPQELADAYLENMRTSSKESFWAYEDVLEACTCELERGVQVTLALIAAARDDGELACIAAGPVEDLLKSHGLRAIEPLEAAAEASEKVRTALDGVWLNEGHEAFPEWKRLLRKYGSRAS